MFAAVRVYSGGSHLPFETALFSFCEVCCRQFESIMPNRVQSNSVPPLLVGGIHCFYGDDTSVKFAIWKIPNKSVF